MQASRKPNSVGLILSALLLFTLLAGCTSGVKLPETSSGSVELSQAEVWELAKEAYVYAFPLVLVDATVKNVTNTVKAEGPKAPANQFIHYKALANAESKLVVTPNVDTVYSLSMLDLSDDAIVFYKPEADRFFSVSLMDMYTDYDAVLGTGGDTQDARTYLITGPDFNGQLPEGLIQVPVTTNTIWLFIRTLVNDEADLENVYALQAQTKLVPLRNYVSNGFNYSPPEGSYDPELDYVPLEHVLQMTPAEFFGTANELLAKYPPSQRDQAELNRIQTIGVGPGLIFDSTVLGDDAEAKWKETIKDLPAQLTEESAKFMRTMDTWQFWGNPIAHFGAEYSYRALIAFAGLAANPTDIAIYPKAGTDSDENLLDGTKKYVLQFSELPPVKEHGFWSVTAYGEDNFLIPNSADRYLINDRSGFQLNADGTLEILIQSEPPADPTLNNNWLPSGDEQYHLILRIYLPTDEVLDGTWIAPTITAL